MVRSVVGLLALAGTVHGQVQCVSPNGTILPNPCPAGYRCCPLAGGFCCNKRHCCDHASDADAGVTSFVSNDGLYCAEGPPRAAEGALAMKKAAPAGGAFNETFGVSGRSCADRGYSVSGGADSCNNGITTSYKAQADAAAFAAAQAAALSAWASMYGLQQDAANLMLACTCQPGSPDLKAVGDQCASLRTTMSGWVHRDPYNGHELMCDEGPFVYATRSLSVLKGSPQLAMHFRDQIAPVPCKELGFPVFYPPADHCYNTSDALTMHIWTKTDIMTDAGIKESEAVESNLTSGGFVTFAQKNGLDDISILNNNLGCNCLGTSSVGKQVASTCWSGKPSDLPHSPVRDWWQGNI